MSPPDGAVDWGDGLARCPWGSAPAEYRAYHDEEWGRPVTDPDLVYEKLCLEGFQAGLSWLTILRKREGFRAAFAGFRMAEVARFGPQDVERLLGDAGIVRHRGKIEAAIANARAGLALAASGSSVSELLWSAARPATVAPATTADLPAITPSSVALARRLRALGFRFLGPTTVYAAVQALGVVNDHLGGCWVRDEVEVLRQREIAGWAAARGG